jgi:hypothetical protein
MEARAETEVMQVMVEMEEQMELEELVVTREQLLTLELAVLCMPVD